MAHEELRVPPGTVVDLATVPTTSADVTSDDKEAGEERLKTLAKELRDLQEVFYADGAKRLLVGVSGGLDSALALLACWLVTRRGRRAATEASATEASAPATRSRATTTGAKADSSSGSSPTCAAEWLRSSTSVTREARRARASSDAPPQPAANATSSRMARIAPRDPFQISSSSIDIVRLSPIRGSLREPGGRRRIRCERALRSADRPGTG